MARTKAAPALPPRPDLVVSVPAWAAPEQLRYAARSWAAHLPHSGLWVAGARPWWLTDAFFLHTEEEGTVAVLRAAVEDPGISDPFLFTREDTVALTPLDGPVPVLHDGPARDVDGLEETVARLAELGHPEPMAYETGLLLVDKAAARVALEAAADLARPHVRTLYGNLAGIGGEPAGDSVIAYRAPGFPQDVPLLSVGADAFRHGFVGAFLREAFPDPGPYELGD